ncbi:MAG TPA: diguanylate cyclase [Geminicoccus sp.]|jgi:diguanylate cyclase (GGDEF)-like protein/PAS domain S-box-containing protein|uniref:diguanylate cyclase domain-containing protein n=1 Tax=Geminicoccus sp. TaxID=2024832 RepID=UPI002E309348|nr:diguanylate cyclase [Geminicoccus sp.]HEX2527361.1 diguanylate cyclase [Geminicoccus sp.]
MAEGLLEYLFGAASFMPHGFCLLWRPDLVALHVVADILTAVAYFSIPAALFMFQRRRKDLEFRAMLLLFVAFITLCGLSHLVGMITLWQPIYGLQGLIKLATGIVSVVTAIVLWRILPAALALPSPAMLRHANAQLLAENRAKHLAEQDLRQAHQELERRVAERTEELAQVNAQLADALSRQSIYLEHSPLAVIEMSHEEDLRGWRIRQWSGRAEAMIGWKKDEVIGRMSREIGLVHPDDRQDAERTTAMVVSGEATRLTVDRRFVTRSGEVRHGRWWVSCYRAHLEAPPTILVLLEDTTEQVEAVGKLHYMAFHDPLTGLLNRAMFNERLDHAMKRAARSGEQIAVMLIDLDRFKQVNDTLGHEAGDLLLQEVARRLLGAARKADSCARLGGDEFALIQEGIRDRAGAERAASRLLAALSEPLVVMDETLDVGASIGVAVWEDRTTGIAELLREADAALYAAKGSGRGRFHLAPDMLAAAG